MLSFLKENKIFEMKSYPRLLVEVLYGVAGGINFFLRHKKKDKDVYIFSTYRSGSTWLAEIIYTFPKFKYVQEPLASSKRKIAKYIAPIEPTDTYLFHKTLAQKENNLKKYIVNQAKGKYVTSRRYDIMSESFEYHTTRSVIKLLRASALIEWFYENFSDELFLILFRHPIPTALSKLKTGIKKDYRETLEKYFSNKNYCDAYLSGSLITYIQESSFNPLEKAIVIWCLDNKPLFDFYAYKKSKENVLMLTYEDMVLKPEEIVNTLCDFMKIDRTKIPTKSLNKKSASTRYNTENKNYNDNAELISGWRKKDVSKEQEAKIFLILKQFNIDLYQCGKDTPQKHVL